MKRVPLYLKILIGMVVGIILGLLATWMGFPDFIRKWVTPWGTIFLNALKLIAIPLVLVSLIKGIGGLKDIRRLSKIGLKSLGLYLATTIIAIIIGLCLVYLINPGEVFPEERTAALKERYIHHIADKETDVNRVKENSPLQFLIEMVPENMIQAAGDNTKMLQIIFIAILAGVALTTIGKERGKPLMDIVDAANDVMLKIVDFIMLYAPFGVIALMADLIVNFSGDEDLFVALGLYTLTVIAGLAILIFVLYPLIIKFFTDTRIKDFLRAVYPVQLLAFSTSSSAATLPVSMEQAERELGVSNQVASFVLPVGVTINMNGTSCYQAIAAVFIAQVMGLDLSFMQIITIILISTLSSIGTPGVPGGSIIMLMIVLGSVGIPAEGLALIVGLDRPLDMLRTVANVTGDISVAMVVENGEKKSQNLPLKKTSEEFTNP